MEYEVNGIHYELVDVIYDDDLIYGVYQNQETGKVIYKVEGLND